jgi:integrase
MSNRINVGSVVQDKRDKVWRFYWWDANGKRRSKTLGRFATKAAAWLAAKPLRDKLERGVESKPSAPPAPTVNNLVDRYRVERMPRRVDTKRTYENWLRNYIIPRWGNSVITDVEPRPVELWLASLPLAPKSRAHIRGVLRMLWDYAAWSSDVPREQRNPMELVRIPGASKRVRMPRSLTVKEFQQFAQHLAEPFRTMALLCCCLGLRISECLALRWADVDWLSGKLLVERGIVAQVVDDVKSPGSRKQLSIAGELRNALQTWKQAAQFSAPGDWMFASPVQLGRLPWSYYQVWRAYQKAAKAAGIGSFGTHCLRHSFRSWLDSVNVPVGIMQKLMRHASITTTMDVYGNAATVDMVAASGKIARLAFNGTGNSTETV